MRTPACEDAIVSTRIEELRAERARLLNCTCRRSDDGAVIEAAGCPVHGDKAGEALSRLSPACAAVAAIAARDVPVGACWAFLDHRTMAEVIALEVARAGLRIECEPAGVCAVASGGRA